MIELGGRTTKSRSFERASGEMGSAPGFRGRPLADVATRLVAIAEGGLERRGFLSASGKDERVHLSWLRQLVGEAK